MQAVPQPARMVLPAPTRGYVARLEGANPNRVPTFALVGALAGARAARQTCPKCKRRYYFCLPLRTQGVCDPCDKGFEPSADTVMTNPATHRLAA